MFEKIGALSNPVKAGIQKGMQATQKGGESKKIICPCQN